jgi:hypothetical protein
VVGIVPAHVGSSPHEQRRKDDVSEKRACEGDGIAVQTSCY